MEDSFSFKRNLLWYLGIIAITLVVFGSSLNGGFVYDDNRQILRNPLIQKSELYTTALTSDVWAFKTNGEAAASNYWRPTFTAWNILNYAVFGDEPFGWHLGNVLLHAVASTLVFVFLLQFGFGRIESCLTAVLFSVHPVHVESVAWIAGSPDILATIFLLITGICLLRFKEGNSGEWMLVGLISFAFALGSKEIALLAIPIFALLMREEGKWKIQESLYFLGIGVGFLVIRSYVLQGVLKSALSSEQGLSEVILTAPTVFLFYLKQAILPFELSPIYGIRAVSEFDGSFVLGALIALLSLALICAASVRERKTLAGLMVFLLFLLPAYNIIPFAQEEIVHDRYLYLPVLGLLMITVPILFAAGKYFKIEPVWIVALFVIVGLLFSFQSSRSSLNWESDVTLWEHAVSVDNSSYFAFSQLGAAYQENDRHEAAENAFQRSLEIKESPRALLGRGISKIGRKEFKAAVSDFEKVISTPNSKAEVYLLFQAYEGLSVAHSNGGDLNAAELALKQGIKRLPIYEAAFETALAVVKYQQNEKQKALLILEKARGKARSERLDQSKHLFFRLGMLYAEQGKPNEARGALQEFLEQSKGSGSKITNDFRNAANEALRKLK